MGGTVLTANKTTQRQDHRNNAMCRHVDKHKIMQEMKQQQGINNSS